MNLPPKLKRWLISWALHLTWKAARATYIWAEGKRPAGGWIQPKPTQDHGRKK